LKVRSSKFEARKALALVIFLLLVVSTEGSVRSCLRSTSNF